MSSLHLLRTGASTCSHGTGCIQGREGVTGTPGIACRANGDRTDTGGGGEVWRAGQFGLAAQEGQDFHLVLAQSFYQYVGKSLGNLQFQPVPVCPDGHTVSLDIPEKVGDVHRDSLRVDFGVAPPLVPTLPSPASLPSLCIWELVTLEASAVSSPGSLSPLASPDFVSEVSLVSVVTLGSEMAWRRMARPLFPVRAGRDTNTPLAARVSASRKTSLDRRAAS